MYDFMNDTSLKNILVRVKKNINVLNYKIYLRCVAKQPFPPKPSSEKHYLNRSKTYFNENIIYCIYDKEDCEIGLENYRDEGLYRYYKVSETKELKILNGLGFLFTLPDTTGIRYY